MTTGSHTYGSFKTAPFNYHDSANPGWRLLGGVQSGLRSTRVWNGADAPQGPPASNPYQTEILKWHVLDKKGNWKIRVTKIRRKASKSRHAKSVPHAYQVTWDRDDRPLCYLKEVIRQNGSGATQTLQWANYVSRNAFGDLLPPIPNVFDANDQIRLINKLANRWKGPDFNPSIFLGELPRALQLLGDTTVKLARAYHLFRKGDIVAAAKTLPYSRTVKGKTATKRAVAGNNWLELQYGWLPLLNDIKSMGEFISHQLWVSPKTRCVARIEKKTDLSSYFSNMRWVNPSTAVCKRERQLIAYLETPPTALQLSGLLDPELVAWELVPFSFVADWIAPIGPYLEARAAAAKMVGTFVTTEVVTRSYAGFVSKPYNTGTETQTYTLTGGASGRTLTTINRSTSNSLGVPMPIVNPLEKVASLGHCLNGLALLTGVVTGANLTKAQNRLLS